MNYFPAVSSILSAAHLNRFLIDTYHLSGDTNCTIIKAGVNHTYAVTGSSGNYVFRVYCHSWRTEREIMEEIRLIEHLRVNNIPVSYAIADTGGNYIQQLQAIEGDRFGVLFSYAEGEKLFYSSGETHSRIGEIMGRIHNLTQGFKMDRVIYTPEILLDESFEQLKQFVPLDTDEMKFMLSAKEYLSGILGQVNMEQVRQGAVHLDIWFDNLNISKQGEVTIFDFDNCGNGWLCYDVGYYLMQLFTVETDPKEYEAKAACFLNGYESVAELSDEEKRIIPFLGTVIYFFYLGVQCERFDDWSNVFISETYLKRFIVARVKKYFDYTMEQLARP